MRQVKDDTPRRSGPGPSKISYRLTRAWAKPAVRNTVLVYLPLTLLGLGGWRLAADDGIRQAVNSTVAEMMDQLAERPEFAVIGVEVSGVSSELRAAVTETVAMAPGTSSLKLDLEEIRKSVEALGAVRDARVRLDPDGTLEISVTERKPRALWRNEAGGLVLVDIEGAVIGLASARADEPDLPLILGDGARAEVDEALGLLDIAAPLAERVRALVRVGERRWDMVLSGDVIVMLPEEGAADALRRIVKLHSQDAVLDRDLAAVDLRFPERPTFRMTPSGLESYRLNKVAEAEAGEET